MIKRVARKQKGELRKLSVTEKFSLLSGDKTGFATKALPHHGIPSLRMADGPSGLTKPGCTAFPSGIAVGASFDRDLVASIAQTMAQEAKSHNVQILLAPCLGLSRHPFGGRNFETFGEDPYLVGEMGRVFVESLQSEGVAACIKHFAVNDQEYLRKDIDTSVARRALLECHLMPFKMAIDAGAKVLMTAYNKVNGRFASENFSLFSILRKDWKFNGPVISDWAAVRDTFASWRAGLDIEMPFPNFYSTKTLQLMLDAGYISVEELDQKVNRLLKLVDWFSTAPKSKKTAKLGGKALALSVAEGSIVLLKNQGILPLDSSAIKRIAVFGAGAKYARVSGGGSAHVSSPDAVSPLSALKARFGNRLQFSEAVQMSGDISSIPEELFSTEEGERGLRGEYFSNQNLSGEPTLVRIDSNIDFDWGWNAPDPSLPIDFFSIRWSGDINLPESADYEFRLRFEYGARFFVNDVLVLDAWSGGSLDRVCLNLPKGKNKICFEYFEAGGKAVVGLGMDKLQQNNEDFAVQAASADVAIVFAGLSEAYESEEKDRTSFALPDGQDALIEKIIEAQPNTIIVLSGGNSVAMPWAQKASAILHSWYGGEMVGEAITKVLLGEVSPSGKCPISFPKRWEDCGAYPNYPESHPWSVQYREDMHVGHRHFSSSDIEPLFSFGHGLSYTTFSFSDLEVNDLSFRFRLQNTGRRDGAEVAQLYVKRPGEKYWFFVNFEKRFLRAGESVQLELLANRALLRTYDESVEDWVLRRGDYHFMIGSSLSEPRLSRVIRLNSRY